MRTLIGTVVLLALTVLAPASAQERVFDVGIHLSLAATDGEPANDIPGAGIAAHYALSERWTLGAAVDRTEYDFEEPAKILGIAQSSSVEPVDAVAEGTTLSFWVERDLAEVGRATTVFLGAGVGAGFIDVPDIAGPRAGGGRFEIHTEADTEIIVSILGGARRRIGERWFGEAGLRLEQHFADWQVADRVSGARGSVDDYLTWGAYVAIGVRW